LLSKIDTQDLLLRPESRLSWISQTGNHIGNSPCNLPQPPCHATSPPCVQGCQLPAGAVQPVISAWRAVPDENIAVCLIAQLAPTRP
jgi:hypothetical protein